MDAVYCRGTHSNSGTTMICGEYDNLRQNWIAARAAYQLALAELQTAANVEEFREALQRANKAFSEYYLVETGLNEHLRAHGCSRVPAFPPLTHSISGAA